MAVPKLRFKREDGTGYPEWEEKPLREVGIYIRGVSYGKDDVTSNQFATLVLRSNNIKENKTLNYNADLQFVNKEPKAEQILKENDIVICMANGSNRLVGKTAQYDGKYLHTITVGAFCGIFRCNLPIIRYTFQSPNYSTFLLLNLQGGDGAIANLKGEDILSFTTYFPCLEEQQNIADFLSVVDEVIAHSEEEVQNLEKQKKAIMQKIFSQEVRFKREDGTDYPKWEKRKFVDIYDEASEGATPSTSIKEYYENGTIPFVKIEDTVNKYIYNVKSFITQEGLDNCSAWLIPENSVIFTNGATIGNVSINKIPVATKQGILGIVPKQFLLYEYLYYWLSTSIFINEVHKRETKGTFATIILKSLNEIAVYIPCLEEQQKIANFLSAYDEAIGYAKQELEHWKMLKKGLLQQMFV